MNRFTPIRIERPSPDGLQTERWRFTVLEATVVLDEYTQESRPSKKHKFRPTATYSRLDGRNKELSEDMVSTPTDVFDEALEAAQNQLRVGLWKRDFGR